MKPAAMPSVAPAAADTRGQVLNFVLLLPFLLAALPVATDSYLPALPAIAAQLGSVATSMTVFALAMGVGQIPMGSLADRFGRRPVLLAGLAAYALAALAAALAPSALLTVARAFQGLSMASIQVCARASVRDLFAPSEGPRVMARGLIGLAAAAITVPLLGAWATQAIGWRWVLGGMSVFATALLLCCWRWYAESKPLAAAARVSMFGGVREIFAMPSFRVFALLSAFSFGGMFCFLVLSPMIYIRHLGLSPSAYAWIPAGSSVFMLLSNAACRRLLARIGIQRTVRLGALCSVAGAGVQALGCLFAPLSLWPLLAGHVLYCVGHGIHQPCGQAGAVSELPHLAGRAVSWSGFIMMSLSFVLGQTVSSFMDPEFHHGAWPMVAPILAMGLAIAAIAFVWLPGLAKRSSASRPRRRLVTSDPRPQGSATVPAALAPRA